MLQAIGKNILVTPVFKVQSKVILTTEQPKPIYWEITSVGEDVDALLDIGDFVFIDQYGMFEIDKDEKIFAVSFEHVRARKTIDD